MKTILMIVTFLLLTAWVLAQEAPKVDSLLLQVPVAAKESPRLRAPQMPAHQIMLPKTLPPPKETLVHGRLRSMKQQIGYVRPAEWPMLASAPWQQLPDGSAVCRVVLRSEGATGLRVQLSGSLGSDGLELRIYDPAGTTVLGPYFSLLLSDDKTWWTPTIFGEAIGLEFHLPAGAPFPPTLPEISAVAHINCELDPGTPMSCHNDVTCSPAWANEASAVARITFISGGDCTACTGALLNRQVMDGSPLLMTARHCIGTQAEASSLEAFWFFQTPSCNGAAPDPNTVPRTNGSRLLKRYADADWTLLGLSEKPPSGYFLGWDAGDWESGDNATGIHHPRGDFKRISFGQSDEPIDDFPFDPDGDMSIDFEADVWSVVYTSGIIQPGSSGSPVFDSARLVRGTLVGGVAQCPSMTARYGRFDEAFPTLEPYLWDIADPVYVDRAFTGEERGTSENPFDSVYQASFAVIAGHEIRIKAGNYPETFRIWRPMTLKAERGTVRIGQ